jgi:predicted amidohydrolase YtcJ
MGWAAARLGPRRIEGAFALRSLLDSGARIANGTDAPVEPVSPARTFAASVGQPGRRPDACLTRGEALASMTAWAAHANFQENLIGSISVGKYADFVVLDRDWMRVPIETIAATRIVATYFAGRCVYGGIP